METQNTKMESVEKDSYCGLGRADYEQITSWGYSIKLFLDDIILTSHDRKITGIALQMITEHNFILAVIGDNVNGEMRAIFVHRSVA